MTTLLFGSGDPVEVAAQPSGDDLWLDFAELTRATGWEIKEEGACLESVCIPLVGAAEDLIEGERFNLAGLARHIEQPVVHDESGSAWAFGSPGWEWRSRLSSRTAPDFTLPDFQGVPHSLSGYRGRKVFLLLWASW